MTIADRIYNELLALDTTVSHTFGGSDDQTLSARAYAIELAGLDPFWRIVLDRLFGEDHCKKAWEVEMERLVAQARLVE